MKGIRLRKIPYPYLLIICIVVILLSSCSTTKNYSGITGVRKYPANTPFIFKNNIDLTAESASKDEKIQIRTRLNNQITDSARVKIKDVVFIFHTISKPPAFDSAAILQSAQNMRSSLVNLGYYNPTVTFNFDTVYKNEGEQKRIITNYHLATGKRTLIDTLAYLFDEPELESLAINSKKDTYLKEGTPVSKNAINAENTRLVNLFSQHGSKLWKESDSVKYLTPIF